MEKCIFLDRDGTLNIEKEYLHKKEDFEWEKNAIEALKMFSDLGYKIIIVTNQSGVARGYYSENDVLLLNNYVKSYLLSKDIKIDEIMYCPHHINGKGKYRLNCKCRKPGIKMFEEARVKYNIDYTKSFMIGDKLSDIEAAIRLGITPIFVRTGHGIEEVDKIYFNTLIYNNVYEAATYIKDINC